MRLNVSLLTVHESVLRLSSTPGGPLRLPHDVVVSTLWSTGLNTVPVQDKVAGKRLLRSKSEAGEKR